uniref:Uncharacterized protein n=1 Tax=Arundo donax TaxID=35708 RepID=A0A0A9EN13_ARUDO
MGRSLVEAVLASPGWTCPRSRATSCCV